MDRFEGRVVVVAGAATGTGAATARRLAAEGARVVVGDIDLAGAESTVGGIVEAGGVGLAVAFDLTDEASVEGLMAAAVDAFGGVDALFANGADLRNETVHADTDVVSIDMDHWDYIQSVTLRGYVLCCRYAIPRMLERGKGAIVCTSSDEPFKVSPVPGHAAYQAAKLGVVALVRHVVSRWGKEGIRCNCLSPGAVGTEVFYRALEGFIDFDVVRQNNPSGRIAEPEDIAGAVAFLLSDDAAGVNAQTLHVNGGNLTV